LKCVSPALQLVCRLEQVIRKAIHVAAVNVPDVIELDLLDAQFLDRFLNKCRRPLEHCNCVGKTDELSHEWNNLSTNGWDVVGTSIHIVVVGVSWHGLAACYETERKSTLGIFADRLMRFPNFWGIDDNKKFVATVSALRVTSHSAIRVAF
jgi:hypothetical protein